jgi:hypothetical protein
MEYKPYNIYGKPLNSSNKPKSSNLNKNYSHYRAVKMRKLKQKVITPKKLKSVSQVINAYDVSKKYPVQEFPCKDIYLLPIWRKKIEQDKKEEEIKNSLTILNKDPKVKPENENEPKLLNL